MDLIAQTIASGITNGVVYALIGVGFALIFNASDVINFAQGEFVMIGGFTYVAVHDAIGNVWVSVLVAIVVPALVGAAVYLGLIAPLRRTSVLRVVMLTLALSVVLKGAALVREGPNPYTAPGLTGNKPLHVLGASITRQSVWLAGALVVVSIALWVFFNRSSLGLRMIACAVDRRAASLCGIDVRRMIFLSWVLSAVLTGLAGALLTPVANVTYDEGFAFSLNGFAAAALGGVGSMSGAIVGGLIIGLANAFAGSYFPTSLSNYHDIVGLVVLVLVLVIRPSGLFGGRAEARHTAEIG